MTWNDALELGIQVELAVLWEEELANITLSGAWLAATPWEWALELGFTQVLLNLVLDWIELTYTSCRVAGSYKTRDSCGW